MKKSLLTLIAGLLALMAQAIPADPTPVQVAQPDGSMVTLVLHGDEFFHYTTTLDGYTVLKNKAGFYTYARLDGDRLVPGDRIARDVAQRNAGDRSALALQPKHLTDHMDYSAGQRMLGRRNSAMRRVGADGLFDYDKFRGLIILVNYTNKRFSMSNPAAFYDDMVNTHDYEGYTLNGRRVKMTGSVRDYFYDNSNHIFDPHFDIVGPVDVPYKSTDPQSYNNTDSIFYAALDAVDDEVNFADYDTDGDGYVDMVFFLVAGYSANYIGNNKDYLWPHMYYLFMAPPHDGKYFWLYACSTEIAGWEGISSDVNGIGTFCHEFGHVLGLPDLYDTDGKNGGGESITPGYWSIMASGSGTRYGRNPVGYSLYERYALGFAHPVLIDDETSITLPPLDTNNEGYRLNTPNEGEFFLIENRQPGKWDINLPGHGMVVARVDSTNAHIWAQNQVNCNPNRNYYELVRAHYEGGDSGSDPFPGTSGITEITNVTDGNLLTWDNRLNPFNIVDITEQDSLITFNVVKDLTIKTITETFETLPVTDNDEVYGVHGVYADWDFLMSKVQAVEVQGGGTNQAVAMIKPSMISTSAPLHIIPYTMLFTVNNPTSVVAMVRFSYSLDRGKTWFDHPEGLVSIPKNSKTTVSLSLPTSAPIMLRFNQASGSNKKFIYLDDIMLYYEKSWPVGVVEGDLNGDNEVNIADINVLIDVLLGTTTDAYLLARADVDGDGEVTISDINTLIDYILAAE